ncbi:YihY family inner membrane protein [Chelativorans sp. ZYF759]|uniref:YihY/virulence factor BrkB family protein n=1 Tax=Chelativorans sp. ZYF759 TaxID=2692213 RepID=UPI00145F32BC|nr:YihY/virulence factor BrkB family protein [Chelativorans sp. ZYF759]NMG39255.1 YihY family inner membrane protein [Chelativorans sp. ZYF759]
MSDGNEDIRGRGAEWPSQIPRLGWRDIMWRMIARFNEDRVMLIAAGATFYLLLALFPALAAFVSIYGFFADPTTIAGHLSMLAGILPQGGLELIEGQLMEFAREGQDTLGISFLIAFAVAFWSANNGVKTLFEALNIAYREREKRSFVALNLLSFVFTIGVMLVAVVLIAVVGILPALLALLPVDEFTDLILRYARWPILLVVAGIGISVLYRFGPSRARAQWRWVSWGSMLACLVWIVASAGFSFYLQGFADYNATYGSLGAAIGFMMWTWISVMVLLVGAQLNAEIEHQTAVDTTTGKPRPMGRRGAVMADTLGPSVDEDAETQRPQG